MLEDLIASKPQIGDVGGGHPRRGHASRNANESFSSANENFSCDLQYASYYVACNVKARPADPMRRKSFGDMQCPIARSLQRVGEWWSILILRDASLGLTRFDQFRKSLKIAPNILSRRLNALVEASLLERRRYSEHPPRDEYVLTERG